MAPGPPFFGFLVADVVAPAHLVFEMRIHPFTGLPQGPDASAPTVHASWAFDLVPIGESSCRLIARNRASVHLPFGLGLPYRLLLEWVEFVMERRMLIGIRDRAERGDSTPIPDHWFGASGDADAEATARDIPTQADGWRRRGEPRRHSDRQFGSRNEA